MTGELAALPVSLLSTVSLYRSCHGLCLCLVFSPVTPGDIKGHSKPALRGASLPTLLLLAPPLTLQPD